MGARTDLLPDVYVDELAKLVDEVPPVPFAELEPVIREDLGEGAFASIDPEPLAAASIAQIHPEVGSHFKKERNGRSRWQRTADTQSRCS